MGLIEVLAIGFIFMGGYLLYAFGNGHFEIKNPTVVTNDGRKNGSKRYI